MFIYKIRSKSRFACGIFDYIRYLIRKLERGSSMRNDFPTFPVLAESGSLRPGNSVKRCADVSTSPAARRREQDSGEE